jgi:hypothetical protein
MESLLTLVRRTKMAAMFLVPVCDDTNPRLKRELKLKLKLKLKMNSRLDLKTRSKLILW